MQTHEQIERLNRKNKLNKLNTIGNKYFPSRTIRVLIDREFSFDSHIYIGEKEHIFLQYIELSAVLAMNTDPPAQDQ